MTPDRDRLALRLLEQALEIAPDRQSAWVQQAVCGDTALADRVLALLKADVAMTDLDQAGSPPPAILPPPQVGVYRLERMIGAGGMGSVWRARRGDGLFEQVVAIKFMAARQGHLDLGPLIDAERRSLARMDHENIARILDGGQTDQGLHYLVMELVDGVAIAATGDVGRSVGLIRQVAAALAHAHQSGIVHCDVKPDNILVTPEGRAKLIDFGIARLQETGAAGGLDGMTRAYASPERMRVTPATLADDVYALAVTLHQLLAGQLPWQDPARPDPDAAPHVARVATRNGEDLTAILAKALSPDARQRYRTIEAFDADLRRWQTLHPVLAVRPRPLYLLRRLAQRRPVPVAAAVGATLAIIGALVVMANLYLAAETARQAAIARFDDLRSLARFMIFDLNTRLEQVPGATPARLALSEQAQFYLDGLAATAQEDSGLQRELATGLLRLAEVQGVPSRPNLGQTALALANLNRALGLFDSLLRDLPLDRVLSADRGELYIFSRSRAGFTIRTQRRNTPWPRGLKPMCWQRWRGPRARAGPIWRCCCWGCD